ncbi:M23 family metallopeptidase [bacterium SCSIO 12741]|nr:M23 family metallopeptidase [bacterium SCSIO 12741]
MMKRIRHKSRLVIMNDDTFEEQFSMNLSMLNVFTWGGLFLLFFATVITLIIAFTPLRELIPGYADIHTRKLATYADIRADSLQNVVRQNKLYLDNIKAIMEGNVPNGEDSSQGKPLVQSAGFQPSSDQPSEDENTLRDHVEREERYNLSHQESGNGEDPLNQLVLFAPIKGMISSPYEASLKHYGIDVVPASEDASVKATYKGMVIQASWTSEEGHVLVIQHPGNLISVYKHNSVLLKKAGDLVKAGEAIAMVGNSGELSTGPHLHFELWFNGQPVDPGKYMVF